MAHPERIPTYIRQNYISKPLSKIHSALIADSLDNQSVRLAHLRSEDDFCLVVLDACRYDFLDDEFENFFYGECEPIWADALNTFQYLRHLWTEQYEYPYVSAASPATSQQFNFQEGENADGILFEGEELLEKYCGYVPNNHLKNLIEVWRESWDEELGVCPPEPVTETAIDTFQTSEHDRIVAHYFQPHSPFIGEKNLEEMNTDFDKGIRGGAVDGEIWSAVQDGEMSKKQLRVFYRSNLRRVLSSVVELIRQTDYDQYVIIGDHGEALGEYNQYYHGIEHPKVRTIPWATVSGVREDAPEMWDYTAPSTSVDKSTESRLQELGYIDQ